jgi:chemotaxis protein histidine kinase CheA
MHKRTMIRTIANASLALLMTASHVASTMEDGDDEGVTISGPAFAELFGESPFPHNGESKSGIKKDPLNFSKIDHSLTEKSEKTTGLAAQIREKVQEILRQFQDNMNAYYQRTGNSKRIGIIEEKFEQEVILKENAEVTAGIEEKEAQQEADKKIGAPEEKAEQEEEKRAQETQEIIKQEAQAQIKREEEEKATREAAKREIKENAKREAAKREEEEKAAREAVEQEAARKAAKEAKETLERETREKAEQEAKKATSPNLLKFVHMDENDTNTDVAASYLKIYKIDNLEGLEEEIVKKRLKVIMTSKNWGRNNRPTAQNMDSLSAAIDLLEWCKNDINVYDNIKAACYYSTIYHVANLESLDKQVVPAHLWAIKTFQALNIAPMPQHINLFCQAIDHPSGLSKDSIALQGVALFINNNTKLPDILVQIDNIDVAFVGKDTYNLRTLYKLTATELNTASLKSAINTKLNSIRDVKPNDLVAFGGATQTESTSIWSSNKSYEVTLKEHEHYPVTKK